MMAYRLLKQALRANALFSLLIAIDILLFSQPIAEVMGGFDSIYLTILGVGLLGFSVFLLFISERRSINLRLVKIITFMDVGWIIGSVLLIIFAPWLSTTGIVLIIGVALVVGLCAYFQTKGMQELIQGNSEYNRMEADV